MGTLQPETAMTRFTMSESGHAVTRAIALVGPAGTGKTSLAEALLYASGTITRQGTIEAGNTVGDSSAEARARCGSTEINLMHCNYMGDRFAIIDVPGGAGFASDGLAALATVDMAILVLDPAPERAVLAEPMLRRLDDMGVPHVIFINKIEAARAGAVRDLIAELQPMSREPLALRQFPIRKADSSGGDHVVGYVDLALERAYRYRPGAQSELIAIPDDLAERERHDRMRLLETLADFDDSLMETLLLDEMPDRDTVMHDLAVDTAYNKVVPVMLGSAQTDGGVRRLLKLLRHEAPSSTNAAMRIGVSEPAFCVFKISNSGAMGRLALGRVLGGALAEGDELAVGSETERTGSIFLVQGEKSRKLGRAEQGDVIAVAKLDGARVGQVLCRYAPSASAISVTYPPRNATLAIATRDRKDDVKLSTALHRLCEEDPALEWTQDDASHETILRGINEEHLAVVLGKLERRYGVAVHSRPPSIAYRESIRKVSTQRGRHKKQSGGHGQYGDCIISVRPAERGAGFVFEDRITGGAIPRQYIPAVELGVRDAMERGPLGFPVVDVSVTLTDGSFHSVDSSELAFRLAGKLAMSEALAQAAPYLLEPVCKVMVDTPQGTGSKASSVMTARRGQIMGLAPHPEWSRWERVEAMLPECGLHGLDAELRSLSQGLASFTASFDHLTELSGKHADEVIKVRAGEMA